MDAGQKIFAFLDAVQRSTPILMAVTFALVVFVCITECRKKLEKRQNQLKKASKERKKEERSENRSSVNFHCVLRYNQSTKVSCKQTC